MIKNFLFKSSSISATAATGSDSSSNSENGSGVVSRNEEIVTENSLQHKSLRRSFSFTNPIKVNGFEEIANHSPNTSNNSIDPYSPTHLQRCKSFTFSGKNYPILKRSKSVQFKLSNNNTIELSPLRNATNIDDYNDEVSPSSKKPVEECAGNDEFDTVPQVDVIHDDEYDEEDNDDGSIRFKTIRKDNRDIQRKLSMVFETNESPSLFENPPSSPNGQEELEPTVSQLFDKVKFHNGLTTPNRIQDEVRANCSELERESIELLSNALDISSTDEHTLESLIKRVVSLITEKEYNEQELKDKITELERQKMLLKDKLELEISLINSSKLDLVNELSELKGVHSTIVTDIQTRLEVQRVEIRNLLNERNEVLSIINEYTYNENFDMSYIDTIKQSFESYEFKLQDLNAKLGQKAIELSEVGESEKFLLDDYNNCRETLNRIIQENSILRNQLSDFSDNFIVNDKLLQEKNNQITSYQENLNQKSKEIEGLNQVIHESKNSKDVLENKINEQRNQIDSLNQLLVDTEGKLKSTNTELEKSLDAILNSKNTEIVKLESQIRELRSNIELKYACKDSNSLSKQSEELLNLQIEFLEKENETMVQKNVQSKKSLDAAQELIKKLHLTKSQLTHDRQSNIVRYRTYYTSNNISLRAIKIMLENSWKSILPLLYEDTDEYFNLLYGPIKRKTTLEIKDAVLLEKLLRFYFRTVEDLVSEFKTNEQLLEKELIQRSNKNVANNLANIFMSETPNKFKSNRHHLTEKK